MGILVVGCALGLQELLVVILYSAKAVSTWAKL